MKPRLEYKSKFFWLASAILLCLAVYSLQAAPETKPTGPASSQPAQSSQMTFASPKLAADALIKAAGTYDVPALKEILGPDSADLISSEDPVMDKNRAINFAEKAKEKTVIAPDKNHPNFVIVSVGNDDFPLPIPIVNNGGKWSFDTKVGREEILNRRIGANELDAIQICLGFDDAEIEYASEKHDGSTVNQYAQRMISTPGKQDGLAWKNPDGTWAGPISETVAQALEQGYTEKSQPQPYHGYYFKVLKGQGPDAPHGEMDFLVNGLMIGGFALAAAPAQYRVTGVKTFIVGPSGTVYEKDLGPDTLKVFQGMDRFNPDKSWQPTDDQWPDSEP